MLRTEIRECIDRDGARVLRRLILASDAFTRLPKPLRGEELRATAKEFGIVQRSERVRIAANVLRMNCKVAQARLRSKTHTDVEQATHPAIIVPTEKNTNTQRRVQACRFNKQERYFLQVIMDKAVAKVQVKDVALCVQSAMHAIHNDKIVHAKASTIMRKEVLDRVLTQGERVLRRMMLRHESYKNLKKPLRGNALRAKANEFGLRQRSKSARVDTAILKEEVQLAPTRIHMKCREDIGRECKRNMTMKMKRLECIRRIVRNACATGTADVTLVWRDFHHSKQILLNVALAAIKSVARQKQVHVLDIHGLTVLFEFNVFQTVLELLKPSYIFAINMGEDGGIFEHRHFKLLATKILDGSCAMRRWFVESNLSRRCILMECGLVSATSSKKKATVFKQARVQDRILWEQGDRESPRLAWLIAPKYAYKGAIAYNCALQDSICNWDHACSITT